MSAACLPIAVSDFKQARAAGHEYHALANLGAIACHPVTTTKQWQDWQSLMAAEHELGAGPLVGARLCYLVHSEHLGVIGALAFSAAA